MMQMLVFVMAVDVVLVWVIKRKLIRQWNESVKSQLKLTSGYWDILSTVCLLH